MSLILLVLLACKGPDTGETGETGHTGDTGPPERAEWVVEDVAGDDSGLQLRLVGHEGELWAAWFDHTPWEDGVCEHVTGDQPPRWRYDLHFARRSGGTWTSELVDSPAVAFSPTGLDLVVSPEGLPVMAWTGGPTEQQYCGANDAILGTRTDTGWTTEAASTESGDSVTGLPASDSGFVVGLWPAAAFDADGQPAVIHRDAHFGSMQHDDLYRADAEYASRSGGAWSTHLAVDASEGAGDYGELLFDSQGRAVAIYAITIEAQTDSRHGVWASRLEEGAWTQPVRLHTGGIHQEIRAVEDSSGGLWVAFYSAADLSPMLLHLADPSRFSEASAWQGSRIGRNLYDEGRHLSMALDTDDQPVLSWHRCRRVDSGTEGCDPDDEAVVYAYQSDGTWHHETVTEAEEGSCGEYTNLVLDQAGTPWVSWRCTILSEGAFVFRTFAAQRVLP